MSDVKSTLKSVRISGVGSVFSSGVVTVFGLMGALSEQAEKIKIKTKKKARIFVRIYASDNLLFSNYNTYY